MDKVQTDFDVIKILIGAVALHGMLPDHSSNYEQKVRSAILIADEFVKQIRAS